LNFQIVKVQAVRTTVYPSGDAEREYLFQGSWHSIPELLAIDSELSQEGESVAPPRSKKNSSKASKKAVDPHPDDIIHPKGGGDTDGGDPPGLQTSQ
jgi:hypothetical protein